MMTLTVPLRKAGSVRSQVPCVAGYASGGSDELCRQHWGQEPLRYCRKRYSRPTQQTTLGSCGGPCAGHCQERKARIKEKG